MKTTPALLVLALFLGAILSPSVRAAEPKATVVDYFLKLPANALEGPAADWLKFLRQPQCGLVDTKNGYLRCTGDGGQASFEVALFRFNDGRPLLAFCSGELEGDDSVYLSFYELGANGQMKAASRSLLPVKDAPAALRFTLPREGRTVLVKEAKTGKVKARYTWNGEKFVSE